MNAARGSRVAFERSVSLGRALAAVAHIALILAMVVVAALVVMSGGAQRALADETPAGKPATKPAAKPAVRNGAARTAAEGASAEKAPAEKVSAEKVSAEKVSAERASAEKAPLDKVPLESVLVVFESSGKLVAMRVVKEHQIAVLQACFPDFHARPKSDAVVKWAPKYEIYFNFQDGRTIRVLVSGNSRYWTTGAGELEMRGMYFSGVIHELLKANMKSGDE